MWQKCPVCDGTGKAVTIKSKDLSGICPVCKGHSIINIETGEAPRLDFMFEDPAEEEELWGVEDTEEKKPFKPYFPVSVEKIAHRAEAIFSKDSFKSLGTSIGQF